LAQEFRDDPQLIRPLFRALTDPTFSDRDRQDALALVNRTRYTGYFIPSALWLLKVYDKRIGDNYDPPIWWARDDQRGSNPRAGSRRCSIGICLSTGASTASRRSAGQSGMLISSAVEYCGVLDMYKAI
jgi:hypothetical protein